ncbi:MAG: copper homeostasis protein CutC [Planctomycetota bacterium]|nr:copper homeostasis protein CutC [Planctomycetota bacterium]
MKNCQVEVCVESLGSALAAEAGGADRIELNSAIGLGGLTPTTTLLHQLRTRISLPVVCMVRPRAGDFCYSQNEFDLMASECSALLEAGAEGIAIGFLDPGRKIDRPRLKKFKSLCGDRELVFHRAFDCASDPSEAIRVLIDHGIQRVLTSGGAATAMQGRQQLHSLVNRFGDRIEILPGAGINSLNVVELVSETGCRQVHGTFAKTVESGSTLSEINFNQPLGLESNQMRESCEQEIRKVVQHLKQLH